MEYDEGQPHHSSQPATSTLQSSRPVQQLSSQPAASINEHATEAGRNTFGSDAEPLPSAHASLTDPFASPIASRPVSSGASSALNAHFDDQAHQYFHSRRVRKGDREKPWLNKKDPKEKWVTILPLVGIFIGLAVSGVLVWDGLKSVVKHKYCLVMSDDFSQGFRTDVWTKEVQVGGFGNGEFEETTADEKNVFIRDGTLWIMPTLQDASLIEKDNVIDLLADGSCTSKLFQDCVAATNTTAGNSSIVPPTLSGRINTKKSASIKYGRVEVTARMPIGDWLWPAIWMLPVNDTYGQWPASGEIDIVESRGNNDSYNLGGNNVVSSTLHWGPAPTFDAWWRTNNKRQALHSSYSDSFHTFGLEWSQKYLFTYVNSRLLQVIYTNFDVPLWQRGNFPDQSSSANYTRVNDVWAQTGRSNTPFDEAFYLVLNVAVGGTNGWFTDNKDGKPWLDDSPNAKLDFWNSRSEWYPTWTQPQMEVSKVQMWQQCDGNEEL